MTRIFPCLADPEKIRVIAEAGDARTARNFQTNRLKIMKGVGLDE
jgi:ArsR family metal-binding transcriptional regulator